MNLQAEKLIVIEKLLQTQEEAIIDQIKAILEDNEKNSWDEPDYVRQSIERSDEQIKRGELKPHQDVMLGFRKKFLK